MLLNDVMYYYLPFFNLIFLMQIYVSYIQLDCESLQEYLMSLLCMLNEMAYIKDMAV